MRQGSVLSFLQSIGVNMDHMDTLESVHSVQYVAKSPPADREELDGTGSQAAGGKHINLNDRKTSNWMSSYLIWLIALLLSLLKAFDSNK